MDLSTINLEDYICVQPESVKIHKSSVETYDIGVEEDHSFWIHLSPHMQVLSHNCDGSHIAALLINFFHRWFPEVLVNNRLFILSMPLLSIDQGKKRKYFYSLKDYGKFASTNNTSNIRYLKGLGSLDLNDWGYIFGNMQLLQIAKDGNTDKYLTIAFGDKAELRKRWLERTS